MHSFNTSKRLFSWTGANFGRRMPACEIKTSYIGVRYAYGVVWQHHKVGQVYYVLSHYNVWVNVCRHIKKIANTLAYVEYAGDAFWARSGYMYAVIRRHTLSYVEGCRFFVHAQNSERSQFIPKKSKWRIVVVPSSVFKNRFSLK